MTVQSYSQRHLRRLFGGARVTAWKQPAGNSLRGGDWCQAFPISAHEIAISVGDVCGHGQRVYEEMLAIREAIRGKLPEERDLAAVLAAANQIAFERDHAVPVTALIGILHTVSNKIWIANAGHPPPLLQDGPSARFCRRSPGDLPLGIWEPHETNIDEIDLNGNSLLVFYTDGIVEHERNIIKGERELMRSVARVYRFPYLHTARAIAYEMGAVGACLPDDAAILTLWTK